MFLFLKRGLKLREKKDFVFFDRDNIRDIYYTVSKTKINDREADLYQIFIDSKEPIKFPKLDKMETHFIFLQLNSFQATEPYFKCFVEECRTILKLENNIDDNSSSDNYYVLR